MRTILNKQIAKAVHAILKRKDPEAKLGHAYDAISRAHGFRDWNTAAAADVAFDEGVVERFVTAYIDDEECT